MPASELGLLAGAEARPDLLVIDAVGIPGQDLPAILGQARAACPGIPVFVRIRRLAEGAQDEFERAMAGRPDGIWLRNVIGRREGEQLASRLAVQEARLGIADGRTAIVASVDSAAGALAASSLPELGPRLAGLSYDIAALSAEIGCDIDASADRPEPLRAVRARVLLAAAAAGVPAIDSAAPPGTDPEAFRREATQAGRDGFAAKLTVALGEVAALRAAVAQAPLGRWMENFVSGVATK